MKSFSRILIALIAFCVATFSTYGVQSIFGTAANIQKPAHPTIMTPQATPMVASCTEHEICKSNTSHAGAGKYYGHVDYLTTVASYNEQTKILKITINSSGPCEFEGKKLWFRIQDQIAKNLFWDGYQIQPNIGSTSLSHQNIDYSLNHCDISIYHLDASAHDDSLYQDIFNAVDNEYILFAIEHEKPPVNIGALKLPEN